MRNWVLCKQFDTEQAAYEFGLQEACAWIDERGMPDKTFSPSIELLDQRMNQLGREIGAMDPDGPRRVELIEEMSALSLISAKMKPKG